MVLTTLTAVAWTGFAVFTFIWAFYVIAGALYQFFTRNNEHKEGAVEWKPFHARQNWIFSLLFVVIMMAEAFSWLPFVSGPGGNAHNNYDFILRVGEDPGNLVVNYGECNGDALNAGVCVIFWKWLWLAIQFVFYGLYFTMVYRYTWLSTVFFIVGCGAQGFALSAAAFISSGTNHASSWVAFAFAGFSWLFTLGVHAYAAFNSKTAADALKDLKIDIETKTYYPPDNPFSGTWILALAIAFDLIFRGAYIILFPFFPLSGLGYLTIDDEIPIWFGLDVMLYGVMVISLYIIWWTVDPSEEAKRGALTMIKLKMQEQKIRELRLRNQNQQNALEKVGADGNLSGHAQASLQLYATQAPLVPIATISPNGSNGSTGASLHRINNNNTHHELVPYSSNRPNRISINTNTNNSRYQNQSPLYKDRH